MGIRISLTGPGGIGSDRGGPSGRALTDAGRLVRRGVAYLVLERTRPVPRTELAAAIWGDDLPETWEASLRKLTARLRRALADGGLPPGCLAVDDGVFRVELPAGTLVDVEEAGAALAAAERALAGGDGAAARRDAADAARLAGAGLLPGEEAPWVERRRIELRDLRVRALEVLSDACALDLDWPAAASAAREAVDASPEREGAAVRLMRALAAAGDRAEALRVHEGLRRRLRDDLGVSPSQATEDAYLALLRDSGPARPAATRPSSPPLPAELTAFVGRADDVGALLRLVGSSRLVTLTGTGGIGKTRLALAVARHLQAGARRVAFADLAPLADPRLVPAALLAALGVVEEAARPAAETIAALLGDDDVVIVVDSCEHVVDAAAELAGALLAACPGIRIVAASREPLRVAGETAWDVRPLTVPAAGAADAASVLASEAGRLFAERATAARAGFELTDAGAGEVARICTRLDGLPLAIELAAARTAAMSPGEIADRLDASFHLLETGPRSSAARHRSLDAAIAWTYDSLDDTARTVFLRLAAFGGTFTLAAAEAVGAGPGIGTADVAAIVAGLVDRSLVLRAAGRYRLLTPLRAFASERLEAGGDGGDAHRALLAWATALAEDADREMDGPGQEGALGRIDADHDNLRAALAWAASTGDGGAVRLAAALGRFWEARGHLAEGRMWLAAALANPDDAPTWAWARALMSAAVLAQLQGDAAAATPMFEAALAMWQRVGDTLGAAAALNGLAGVADLAGDSGRARDLYERCLEIGRRRGDERVCAAALGNLGRLAHRRADYAAARALYEESLALSRRLADGRATAAALGNLGFLEHETGGGGAARPLLEESLALRRRLGDRHGVALVVGNLGHLALAAGDLEEAERLYNESLDLRRELGDGVGVPGSLLNLAELARARGDAPRSRELAAEALAAAERIGDRHRAVQATLALARAEASSGGAGAAALAARSLDAARDLGAGALVCDAAEALVEIHAAAARWEDAAEAAGAAAAARDRIGVPLAGAHHTANARAVAATRRALPPEAFASAFARGARGAPSDSRSD